MVFGCLGAGYLIDNLGRKTGHLVLAVISLISWLIIAFSTNYTYMLIGRCISGISVGSNRPVSMVYIGEITTPKYRSLTLVGTSFSLTLGVLISHIIAGYMSWRRCTYIFAAINAFCIILVLFLPESPLWLISKGKLEEGTKVYKRLRGHDTESEKELQMILMRQNEKSNHHFYKDILSMSFTKPLSVVFLLAFIQLNGINVFGFYAQDIIKVTFKGNIDPFLFMLAYDSLRIGIMFLVMFFNKFIPRKIFFTVVSFCSTVSLFILVVYLLNIELIGRTWLSITIAVSYIIFAGHAITLGWSFIPELFSANLRGLGSGIGAAMLYFVLFIAVKVCPGFMAAYGAAAMYALYGTISGVSTIILCFVLPETNGRTLQDIEDSYKKNNTIVSSL